MSEFTKTLLNGKYFLSVRALKVTYLEHRSTNNANRMNKTVLIIITQINNECFCTHNVICVSGVYLLMSVPVGLLESVHCVLCALPTDCSTCSLTQTVALKINHQGVILIVRDGNSTEQ